MKKLAPVCLLLAALLSVQAGCKNKRSAAAGCYKGRLEIKAICMNYTLAVTGGAIDTALVENSWRDEQTGKTYRNAFGLASPCDFPDSLKQGDEFYFTIDSSVNKDCATCRAFYPTPAKKLFIRIQPNPCQP